jgi:tRNA1(Val) A37 N6-methylase TrmN6
MRLSFDADLAWMDIFAEGRDEIEGMLDGSIEDDGERLLIARFERPVLVTDPYRIGLLPSRTRDPLHALYGRSRRTIAFDGVELAFDQERFPGVWSPSIDTLLVCRAIRGALHALRGARSALEIGCGSGYLSLYLMEALARAGQPLDELHLIDIDGQAVQAAMAAIDPRSGSTVVSASLGRRGEALRVRGKYDVILMNPPYIRRPPDLVRSRYQDNPWEGVSLLRELAERGRDFLTPTGSLIVVLSSLCDDLARPWLEHAFDLETLTALDVPLKVYAVTSGLTGKSRRWLAFLQQSEGLLLCDPPRDGYEAWQRIEVLRCRPKAAGAAVPFPSGNE